MNGYDAEPNEASRLGVEAVLCPTGMPRQTPSALAIVARRWLVCAVCGHRSASWRRACATCGTRLDAPTGSHQG
jgi:hypothetical protein